MSSCSAARMSVSPPSSAACRELHSVGDAPPLPPGERLRRRTAAHARAASHHQLRRRRRPPPPAESDRAAAAHRRSPAPIAAPAAVVAAAAAAAARPPQARPHAYAHASARAAPRRAALTARRRPPSRAIAVQRAERRRAARARPRRARRPRAPARESGRHTACGAAVETNLLTFTSVSGGVRNALAPPHRARKRRRARRARASTRRPPPRRCANSAGAAARGVMSSTADLRSWVGRPVGTDDLCSAVAVVDAMVGLWRAGSAPVVTPREPGDPVARRPLHKATFVVRFRHPAVAVGAALRRTSRKWSAKRPRPPTCERAPSRSRA